MQFVADENLDSEIVSALRRLGHQVLYVAEMARGITDDKVLALARAESAILVTGDKDFGALVFARGLSHCGVVLIRLHGWSSDRKAERVMALLAEQGNEIHGSFTVIDERGVRTKAP